VRFPLRAGWPEPARRPVRLVVPCCREMAWPAAGPLLAVIDLLDEGVATSVLGGFGLPAVVILTLVYIIRR